jgi:hypothetical protein
MKLLALHDQEGRILAAVRHSGYYNGPKPVPGQGDTVVEIDVPDAHGHLGLDAICRRFRIHPKSRLLFEPSATQTDY